jgi:hypothetical protein
MTLEKFVGRRENICFQGVLFEFTGLRATDDSICVCFVFVCRDSKYHAKERERERDRETERARASERSLCRNCKSQTLPCVCACVCGCS